MAIIGANENLLVCNMIYHYNGEEFPDDIVHKALAGDKTYEELIYRTLEPTGFTKVREVFKAAKAEYNNSGKEKA